MTISIPSLDPKNINKSVYDFDENNPNILKELEYIKDNFDKIVNKEKLPEKEIFTVDEFSDRDLYNPNIKKDLDDWVRVERLWDWYRLITSIANPTEVIERGSEIEKQAILKTTSIYDPDRVIPMLPWDLATYYLSLNYDTIRLALTTEIDFDKDWNFLAIKMYRSRVKNICMFNYNLFTETLTHKNSDFFDEVQLMNELRWVLNIKRRSDWSGENFDDARRTIWYHKNRSTHIASQFIEEAMIATNMYVAKYLHDNDINAIFRNHMPEFIWKEFESNEMLRAFYSAMNEWHYALWIQYYMHFTSPIRRIVDYISHIVINNFLKWEQQEISGKETFDLCEYINLRQEFILWNTDKENKKIDKEDDIIKFLSNMNEKKLGVMDKRDFNEMLIFKISKNQALWDIILNEIKKRIYKLNYDGFFLAILVLSWNKEIQDLAKWVLLKNSNYKFLKWFIDNNLAKKLHLQRVKIDNTSCKSELNYNKKGIAFIPNNKYKSSVKYRLYKKTNKSSELLFENDNAKNHKSTTHEVINFIIDSGINYLK